MLCSHLFSPSVGGIETISELLARHFVSRAHEVKIVTQTEGEDGKLHSYEVFRKPEIVTLRKLVNWCDVFFQNNISLQTAVALIGTRKPWFVTHQTWITRAGGTRGWQDFLKRWLLRFAHNISISRRIAEELGGPSVLIANAYDSEVFREESNPTGRSGLIFVGRLVSDKGVDLLLEAVARLRQSSLTPILTIVGEGPERDNLMKLAQELGVSSQIRWPGKIVGSGLARLLNAHEIIVVPSRWEEPFGIVALEGIACGCIAIGTDGGGLPDAIGPCGITVPNGDAPALADALRIALTDPNCRGALRRNAGGHLSRHTPKSVGDAYLNLFEKVLAEKGKQG